MAIKLEDKTNVIAPSSTYPYGDIKDNPGNNTGTPVNRATMADYFQFFAKMLAESGITANGLPDNADNGFQYFEALVKAVNNNNSAGIIETEAGNTLKVKVIEIGDWDMDTDGTKNVAHGLVNYKNIRSISVIIRDDNDTTYYNLEHMTGSSTPIFGGRVASVNSTNIILARISETLADQLVTTGSATAQFDNAGFDSTSYNRGWITIVHL